MTRDELMAALDRYGSDLSRWPDTLGEDARALIASDARAASESEIARRLDGLLSELTAPQAIDSALVGRILSDERTGHGEVVLRPTPRLAGWASAAVAATLMIGFVVGALVPVDDNSDAVAALLFSESAEDLDGELL